VRNLPLHSDTSLRPFDSTQRAEYRLLCLRICSLLSTFANMSHCPYTVTILLLCRNHMTLRARDRNPSRSHSRPRHASTHPKSLFMNFQGHRSGPSFDPLENALDLPFPFARRVDRGTRRNVRAYGRASAMSSLCKICFPQTRLCKAEEVSLYTKDNGPLARIIHEGGRSEGLLCYKHVV
jgi:hypothetical protein